MEADDDLLNISISDSDDSREPRRPRDEQTEEQFLAVKREYRPKIENGEIWKRVRLPLGETVSKPDAQELLHAAEELYYLRRYGEALAFVGRVLEGTDASGLDVDTREMLARYRSRLAARVEADGQGRGEEKQGPGPGAGSCCWASASEGAVGNGA